MIKQTIDYSGFAAWLSRNDRRNSTIRKHMNALHYLERCEVKLDKVSLEKFLVGLKDQGKSGAYLNGFVGTVSLYGQFQNVDLRVKEFRVRPTVKATLSDDEIDAFLSLPRRKNQSPVHHLKLTMFWKIVADTGLRPGECAVLKPKHFDWGRGIISIETSKTNQPGQVPIPPNISEEIKDYLKKFAFDEYIFPSGNGGLTYSGAPVLDNVAWHFDWKKRLKAMGLQRPNLTPYSFRHSYATRLLEEEVSLFHVKKLMRHNDLKSTLVYEHLTTKDLIKAQQKLPRIRRNSDPKTVLQQIADLVKSFHIEEDARFNYRIDENDHSIRFEVYLKGLLFCVLTSDIMYTMLSLENGILF